VQAYLGPGHVCTIMGYTEYEPIAAAYRVPIVITGFEPVDLLQGILMAVRQLEAGRHEVENQYSRVPSRKGNLAAQALMLQVFEIADRKWRGVGRQADALLPDRLHGRTWAGNGELSRSAHAELLRDLFEPCRRRSGAPPVGDGARRQNDKMHI